MTDLEPPPESSAYAELLADLARRPDAIEELAAEALRAHDDHAGACRLAWELYLAGTEQTGESFRGVRVAPVADVEAHLADVRATEAAAVDAVLHAAINITAGAHRATAALRDAADRRNA